MKKSMISMAVLGAIGLMQVASAGQPPPSASRNDVDTDASPDSLDIIRCEVESDVSSMEITVKMTLQGNVCTTSDEKKAHWRIHYDYTGDLVTDHTAGSGDCEAGDRGTTSDDTSHVRCRKNLSTRSTGPGADGNVSGDEIEFVVPYADLGLIPGDRLLVWCDTSLRGFIDAAPDRDGTDGCNKPELLTEVLEIRLEDAD